MDKELLRKIAKLSERLPNEVREAYSRAITEFTVSLREVKEARNILLFLSLPNEPDTDGLIKELRLQGKNIFVPVVRGEEFVISAYAPGDPVKKGSFGIREPICDTASEVIPDVAVVPMVAFDNAFTRLGHGKGYYDRYLAGKDIVKIGVCYASRKFKEIPRDPNDVAMDVIVTEEGILKGDESNRR